MHLSKYAASRARNKQTNKKRTAEAKTFPPPLANFDFPPLPNLFVALLENVAQKLNLGHFQHLWVKGEEPERWRMRAAHGTLPEAEFLFFPLPISLPTGYISVSASDAETAAP